MPHPMDYAPLILTMKTSQRYCCYLVCESDNCYQFKTFALLMYSRGVSPRIPSNPMMSQCPCGICLHSLIMISQSVAHILASQSALSLPGQPISIQSLLGHTPHGLHKPQDMPCSLHSDSDQQEDNINCTQPLASSTFNLDNSATHFISMLSKTAPHYLLHQHVATARLSHLLQLHASSAILSYQLHLHVIIHSQGKCSSFFNAH